DQMEQVDCGGNGGPQAAARRGQVAAAGGTARGAGGYTHPPYFEHGKHTMIQAKALAEPADMEAIEFQRLKTSIHEEIVESLDLSLAGQVPREHLETEVSELAAEIIARRRLPLGDALRQRLLKELHDEVFGLGPIEPLMHDATVSDILVNDAHEVYVERH